ncbi:protein kinase STUNTED isoform X2 [Cryptomeria japonica]|nr:protein kinase STUNTED isoform X2 [Cryptomeria japonica]
MKKLPCSTSVLVVENGKVIFEKVGVQHLSVTANAPRLGLFNPILWRIKSKNCKVLKNGGGNYLPVVECPLEGTAVISSNNYGSDASDNICDLVSDIDCCKISPVNIVNVCQYTLSDKEAFERSFLSLKSSCALCDSNIQTLVCSEKKYEGHELKDSRSLSTCSSLQTVSSTSSLFSHREEEIGSCTTVKPKVSNLLMSGLHRQKGVSPPRWPFLQRAISFSKLPRHQSIPRKRSVIELAQQLPYSHAQTSEQFEVKPEVAHEICNQEYKMQFPKEVTLVKASEEEAGFPCSEHVEPIPEEHYMAKKLESLCEGKACRKFMYQELQSATSNFSAGSFIASGGWSRVYKGFLPDGQTVAVKVLNCSSDAEEEIILEVDILTSLKHNCIISLLGYCVEGPNWLLVYNFVSGGNLEENLHVGKDKPVLCWTERFKVAIGVAEALDHLHNGCSRSVIHRDVKSSNILLSENFEPQLADFGLAKWAPITSSHISCSDVLGTFGYLAPEYFIYGKVNDKTDVYAFGVVLLELITGRKPIDSRYPKGQESLVIWAKPLLEESMGELVDQRLENAYDINEMQRMMLAALLCITQSSQYRPHISWILKILRGEDDLANQTWFQHTMTKERDASDDDEHIVYQGGHAIQTHLSLAMLGVDDDTISMSSIDQSVDILQAKDSFEDYLKS